MPDSPLLSVEAIDVFYGDFQALFGVSLNVKAGEVVAVIGANGAGKSTLLRSVSGLMHPRHGRIAFDGADIGEQPAFAVVKRGIAMVPEGRRLFPSLSVEENLTVAARPGTWDLPAVYKLFPRLNERSGNMGNQLSGGEQQMLAIARALMTNPSLLLLDEPFEGLAPVIIEELEAAIKAMLAEQRIAIVLVEQHSEIALGMTSDAMVLERGTVVYHESAEALRNDSATLDRLVGLRVGATA